MEWLTIILLVISFFYYGNLQLPHSAVLGEKIIVTSTIPVLHALPLGPTKVSSDTPTIAATNFLAIDLASDFQLAGNNANQVRSIASISKLLTALVFLDHNPGWDKKYTLTKADERAGQKPDLFNGDQLTVKDLFFAMLVGSDNNATVALAHATGLSDAQFAQTMNDKAKVIGMTQANFVEPTGLDARNQASARDVYHLAQTALSFPIISNATRQPDYVLTTTAGKEITIKSTDHFTGVFGLDKAIKLLGGKTGSLDEAGYCFVGWFSCHGHAIMTVVLGTDSNDARFVQTQKLLAWINHSYKWN